MNPTQPTTPSYNLYEELPEPIFQEMRDKEEEKEKVNKMVNDCFVLYSDEK